MAIELQRRIGLRLEISLFFIRVRILFSCTLSRMFGWNQYKKMFPSSHLSAFLCQHARIENATENATHGEPR